MHFISPAAANVIMDTTYFGRSFGVMVLLDSISGKALSVSEVKYETNEQYFTAIGTYIRLPSATLSKNKKVSMQ